MEVSANKENKSMPQDPQDNKVVQCASNLQDKNFHAEEASHGDGAKAAAIGSEDVEVNIIDCTTASYNKQIEARCDDAATESISSFGDTESETKNGTSGLSDTEIESQLFVGGGQMSIFEGYGGSFQMRRKKLTDHWRRFIRPLMWRCKWVELKIKELQSHAFKYDREIAEDEQRKMFDLETFIGGFPVKSLPFSTCMTRKKAMTRKKRKRFEETEDVASYMLQHNLFSYYVNKKSTTDVASIDDGCSNPAKTINDNDEFGTQDGLTSLQSRDSISEHILRQIEVLKSQVHKLKSRADKVACENPVNFFPVNDLSILAPCNALTSSEQNRASVPKIGDRLLHIQTQRMSGCNMGDLMPESAISSHGEATFRSDMIGNTCQPNGGVSCGNAEEGILIRNAAVKEEIGNLKHFDSGLTEKALGVSEKQTVQASDPDLPEEMLVARVLYGGKSLPKSRSNVSNYKRKRGRKN
ncbi:ELONGATION FACTOR [Salix viminalis]|uniref:ELONGATION FACTOR n=1 Tax=Salix viminalis TaxID=40686 RepID=A0A9Q0ZII2_SALVM|nr:ELONGATION FACTOR [Salix viminalis]KAJ6735599.1 ELONGATION FACTOR [Salix viminalis]